MDNRKYAETYELQKVIDFWSDALQRHVVIDFFLPPDYQQSGLEYPLLLLNDGQDCEAVKLRPHLGRLTLEGLIMPLIAVAVYAGDRKQEYGVAAQPDYKNRGSKAGLYTRFITDELLPYIAQNYAVNLMHEKNTIAGFSLGGLSAFDIAWNNDTFFKQTGAFSGSFWWRNQPATAENPDLHRIMHEEVRNANFKPNLRFWFQSGTYDEQDDRNNNGVIDVIDDILDLSVELVCKGYRPFYDICYLEILNGQHNMHTWAKAMPHFLKWAFGYLPHHSVEL